MGDRANVYVHEGDRPGVYLYTHWEGTDLPKVVKNALARGKERWHDTAYLTRIIFSDMVAGDLESLTGFGISIEETDGEGRLIDIDTLRQQVTVIGWNDDPDDPDIPSWDDRPMSFKSLAE